MEERKLMNERLTWKEVTEKYPDRWIAVTDCVGKYTPDFTVTVLAVCMFTERREVAYELILQGVNFDWEKTLNLETYYSLGDNRLEERKLMNERLAWKEVEEKYPDRWLAVTDCVGEYTPDFTVTVIAVCTCAERYGTLVWLLDQDIRFNWRDTIEMFGGRYYG